VKPSGSRAWLLRKQVGNKRRDFGLGGFPDVTLAEARQRARELRSMVAAGVDPAVERRAARAAMLAAQAGEVTFREAARQCHASLAQGFRNPKHRAQWFATVECYANPVIGDLPVHAVKLAHVVRILTTADLWTCKTETATRLRQRIESVLAWATVRGYRHGDNPARWKGHLDAVLPKPGSVSSVTHHRALPIDAMPGFIADLRSRDGIAARALEFTILTACRSGEVRGTIWDEVDLDGRVWTVPAARMKARRDHRVPLSDRALAILKSVPRMDGCPYLFPAARGGRLSDMALTAVMRRMNVDAVPHGFRSTFRDWCAERTSTPHEVAEKALAHVITSAVERAYRRGDLLAKRVKLMNEWARFLDSPAPAAVAPIMKRLA